MQAQLGFCQGNSGDPIFVEDFGVGLNDTPLPPGTTTYNYANGQPPNDGLYTVTSNTNYFDWFFTGDHTPNDTHGRMLIVNSSFSPGEFYRTTITGLCENTTYEFSSWLLNLSPLNGYCGAGAIPVNVSFEIWDSTDSNLLASGSTGNITGTLAPIWDQFALVFQTIPSQTSVILKMINNSSGGCGNDVAIDDIVFKSCGDEITIADTGNNNSVSFCSTQAPFSDTIFAQPDNIVFSSHFYQWQSSNDGLNWVDIPGETMANLTINNITTTTFFRAKVAEFPINLDNEDCITFSDIYEVNITQAPTQPVLECWQTALFDDNICNWVITGTQPTAPTNLECWEIATFNNATCSWEVTGNQPTQPIIECWESATFNDTTCIWEVTGNQPMQPALECWETAVFDNALCDWTITGTQPASPTGLACWESTIFNNSTCSWEIIGTQPAQPTIACWETVTFNTTTCAWDVTGTEPTVPTGLACWEMATFNTVNCSWEVSGTAPEPPTNLACWETTLFNEVTCSWEISGTQPEAPINLDCWETATFNDATCLWEIIGVAPEEPMDLQCWQSTQFNLTTCQWGIIGTQPIETRDAFLTLCEDELITLIATTSISNPVYQWNSGETTPSIDISAGGVYAVEVTDGCATEIITFNVTEIENPIIENITTLGSSIIINTVDTGAIQYSIDGINYQLSNTFSNLPSGLYTIYVKSTQCNTITIQEHAHFYIPKFMTPNDDGKNDFFSLNLDPFFTSSEVYIFDRYGKLLFSATNRNVNWDGTFNGQDLPTSDYWYRIVLDGKELKGHFTLKR